MAKVITLKMTIEHLLDCKLCQATYPLIYRAVLSEKEESGKAVLSEPEPSGVRTSRDRHAEAIARGASSA